MLSLTNDERRVILFLAFVFLAGLGADFASKHVAPRLIPASFSQDLGKVNLNTADQKLLMSISGIGEKLSQRIIDFREAKGGFECVEELRGVKGVSEAKFSKIKDYLYAGK